MKKVLALTTALVGFGSVASAEEVTVMGWGGAYATSQIEAYFKPYTAAKGVKINSVDADNPATPTKAQVDAGNVTIDVASLEIADAVRLCDEGSLVSFDFSTFPAGADGTPAEEDFIAGTLSECMVPTDIFSVAIAFDTTKFPADAQPKALADFFDQEKFPGKRSVRKNAKTTLEMALMADGVPAADVYAMLETEEGVARAFAKLDTIKKDTVFWEAGSQAPQLLADGEVTMAMAYNGRIFNAVQLEGKPFEIIWDGQVFEWEGYSIPKGAPNEAAALEFVKYATSSEALAKAAEYISYGPPRKSSAALVGNVQGTQTPMAPNLPTDPANMTNALGSSLDFWVDRDIELNERFNAWLLASG